MNRRDLLRSSFAATWMLVVTSARADTVLAVRVWPAKSYTRVTIELDREVKFISQYLRNPDRLFVDLESVTLDEAMREIVAKVQPNDPYIASVRVGQYTATTVRLVFDLKTGVKPQLFSLKPVGPYQHRLVFDIYPLLEVDPLSQLLSAAQTPAKKPDPLEDLLKNRPQAPAQPGRKPNPPVEAKVERVITVALDPGHGGEDPGAIGRAGTYEKNVVLSIAKRLRDRIQKEPNWRVYMTRDDDYFVPLSERVRRARRVKADVFVSIHADAFINPRARGASVFVLSERNASSAAARWLASKENSADQIGGIQTSNHAAAPVLLSLATEAQVRNSLRLGKSILGELGGFARLHKPAVEQANFAVLRAPDIPSILVETAFISNPEEEARLVDESYQNRLSEGLFTGLRNYFKRNPPKGGSQT